MFDAKEDDVDELRVDIRPEERLVALVHHLTFLLRRLLCYSVLVLTSHE